MIKKIENNIDIENVCLKNILPINCQDISISVSEDNKIIKTLSSNVTGEYLKLWTKNAGKYLINDLKNLIKGEIVNDYYYIKLNNKKYLCKIINEDFLKNVQPNMFILERNNIYFLVVNNFACNEVKSFELFDDIIPEIKPNQIEIEDRELMNDYSNSVSLLE